MAKSYQFGEIVCCPYCDEKQEGTVEDFVIPGKSGVDSECEDQCWCCDEIFIVYYDEEEGYFVRKAEEDRDDVDCDDFEEDDEDDFA